MQGSYPVAKATSEEIIASVVQCFADGVVVLDHGDRWMCYAVNPFDSICGVKTDNVQSVWFEKLAIPDENV